MINRFKSDRRSPHGSPAGCRGLRSGPRAILKDSQAKFCDRRVTRSSFLHVDAELIGQTVSRRLIVRYFQDTYFAVSMSVRLPILVTPGVVSVVGFGKAPVAIPDEEIEAVRTLLRSG